QHDPVIVRLLFQFFTQAPVTMVARHFRFDPETKRCYGLRLNAQETWEFARLLGEPERSTHGLKQLGYGSFPLRDFGAGARFLTPSGIVGQVAHRQDRPGSVIAFHYPDTLHVRKVRCVPESRVAALSMEQATALERLLQEQAQSA